jgi:hypothetical protein
MRTPLRRQIKRNMLRRCSETQGGILSIFGKPREKCYAAHCATRSSWCLRLAASLPSRPRKMVRTDHKFLGKQTHLGYFCTRQWGPRRWRAKVTPLPPNDLRRRARRPHVQNSKIPECYALFAEIASDVLCKKRSTPLTTMLSTSFPAILRVNQVRTHRFS